MTKGLTKAIFYWAPRIATILFAMFISLFSFDVFEECYSLFETILAFFIHLIPVFIVLFILIVSWKREWIGGILYITLAFIYIFVSLGKFNFSVFWIIPFPLIIVGILFLVGWFKRKELRPS